MADSAANTTLNFRMYLKTRDEAGAEASARAVSDPRSPDYRHYLSVDQVRARFAPTASTVSSVRDWLKSEGFQLGAIPANNAYVSVTGTVAQVDRAFNVRIGEYAVHGKRLRAANTSLSLPAGLADVVLGVAGINQTLSHMTPDHTTGDSTADWIIDTPKAVRPGVVPPPAGFRNAQPCGAYYNQLVDTTDPQYAGQNLPYTPCGYTPAQVRSAGGLASAVDRGIDGRGTTVAIVDAFGSPTLFADAAEYASRHDSTHPLRAEQYAQQVATPTPGQEDPSQCDAASWYGEQALDVEAVHGVAPGANILFVGAADCQDDSLDAAVNSVVAEDSADIVSNSYGDGGEDLPAADVQEFHQIAVQAALEGIGLYFSSGDAGDETAALGHPEADYAASDPWVTAVGGTSLGIGADGRKMVETGWETGKSTLTGGSWSTTGYDYGSGGGTSKLFAQPFYQVGVVPDALAARNQTGGGLGRVVPDVSDLADPNTGLLIGITQTFPDGTYYDEYRIGGTSLAAPLFAGTMADADQFEGFHHGFSNPIFYLLSAHTDALTDVVPAAEPGVVRVDYVNGIDAGQGYLRTARTFDDHSLTIHTAAGYDDVTGLGTPNGVAFLGLS